MCRKLLFLIVLFCAVDNAQWVQTNGPYGGDVNCLLFKGTFLFAVVNGSVYFSANRGTNWAPANIGLPDYAVSSLAEGAAGNLFAGTNGGGVYISTNNGTSWSADTAGLSYKSVSSFAVSGSNLFAGTNGGGVFLSTNNGTNWTPVNDGLSNANSLYVSSLVVSPTGTGDTNLFAGTKAGVFLSTNNGTSWTSVLSGNGDIYHLAVSSNGTGGTNLFAGYSFETGLGGGIALSTNNGTSWSSINPSEYAGAVAILSLTALPNGTGGTNLYAGLLPNPDIASLYTGGGLLLSTDNGTSWTAIDKGLTNNIVETMAFTPNFTPNGPRGTNIFAGTPAGIYLSTNNGTSWTPVVDSGLTNLSVSSLGAFIQGGTNVTYLFASAGKEGIFLSTDNGTSWAQADSGLSNLDVTAFAFSPVTDRPVPSWGETNVFAGTYFGRVYLYNGAVLPSMASWSEVDSGLINNCGSVLTLAVYPAGTGAANLLAGTSNGVFLSTNSGTSWAQCGLANINVSSFASDIIGAGPAGGGGLNLFAGTFNSGIYLSTNNGTNWTPVDSGLTNTYIRALAVSSNGMTGGVSYIVAGTDNGLFLSTNSGTSWVKTGLINTSFVFSVSSLAVAVTAPNSTDIFAGTNTGVFLSTNNGQSWSPVNTGLTNTSINVNSLIVSGTNLIAATSGGIWIRPLSDMITGVKNQQYNLPANYSLQQNYPNPFNPSTIINYSVPKAGFVTIKVYNVLGKEVATLVDREKSAGNYSVQFNAGKLASGIYFYRMQSGSFVQTKKLTLLK